VTATRPTGTLVSIVVPDKTAALIVEDDQNIVELVRSSRSARGHDVIVFRDGTGVGRVPEPRYSTRCCWRRAAVQH
jgi:hypothetical protein